MIKQDIKGIAVIFSYHLNNESFQERHLKRIKDAVPKAEIVVIRKPEEWDQLAAAKNFIFDVMLGINVNEWIGRFPSLKWIQLFSAGADQVLSSAEFYKRNIFLTNVSGIHAIPISEHIIAFMLSFSHQFHKYTKNQLLKRWDIDIAIQELEGTTLGLIGVGKIGEKTAEKAKAMGMKVLGVRRNPQKSCPFVDHMFGPDELHRMLPMSDWVVITAASTIETNEMIGQAEIGCMKKTAVIINIARGSLIQESALIQALQENRIAGACLDVFENEPLPDTSPLWEMPQVIITPHISGKTPHYIDRALDIFIENLGRYQCGEPLINLVNKNLGY